MGKAAMCIKMLQILNTGRVYRISELAEMLETNPRNIIEYKKELDELSIDSGFYIETIPGRYGGYKLNGNAVIPALRLTQVEKEVTIDAYNYVLSKKDFVKKDDLTKSFSKILSNINIIEKNNDLMVVDKYQLSMGEKDILDRYKFLEESIKLKKEIQIEYLSIKNGIKKHILHPYKLFIYNNSWFFLAWNPEVGDVWYFKVNRIQKYKMLDKKFTVWKYFKPENYFDNQGLTQNGEYHNIELIATGTRTILFKERIYGKNQKITELDNGSISVNLDMQNEEMIVSFVLSCGKEVKIIKPQWLKDKVIELSKEIVRVYTEG